MAGVSIAASSVQVRPTPSALRVLLAADFGKADHADAEPSFGGKSERGGERCCQPIRRRRVRGRHAERDQRDEDADCGERQRAASAEDVVADPAPPEPSRDRCNLRDREEADGDSDRIERGMHEREARKPISANCAQIKIIDVIVSRMSRGSRAIEIISSSIAPARRVRPEAPAARDRVPTPRCTP